MSMSASFNLSMGRPVASMAVPTEERVGREHGLRTHGHGGGERAEGARGAGPQRHVLADAMMQMLGMNGSDSHTDEAVGQAGETTDAALGQDDRETREAVFRFAHALMKDLKQIGGGSDDGGEGRRHGHGHHGWGGRRGWGDLSQQLRNLTHAVQTRAEGAAPAVAGETSVAVSASSAQGDAGLDVEVSVSTGSGSTMSQGVQVHVVVQQGSYAPVVTPGTAAPAPMVEAAQDDCAQGDCDDAPAQAADACMEEACDDAVEATSDAAPEVEADACGDDPCAEVGDGAEAPEAQAADAEEAAEPAPRAAAAAPSASAPALTSVGGTTLHVRVVTQPTAAAQATVPGTPSVSASTDIQAAGDALLLGKEDLPQPITPISAAVHLMQVPSSQLLEAFSALRAAIPNAPAWAQQGGELDQLGVFLQRLSEAVGTYGCAPEAKGWLLHATA